MIAIYGLYDENDYIRYIGKTRHLLRKRLHQHITSAPHSKEHRGYWVMSMLKQGKRHTLQEL